MLRGLFRARAAGFSRAAVRSPGVSGPFSSLTAWAGQQLGRRFGARITTWQQRPSGMWSGLLLRLYHAGKGKGGSGQKGGGKPGPRAAKDEDRQASIARIKEIDRLGEAKDVQGLLRFASEHVQSFNYRHCGAWLSRWARQPQHHLRGEAPAEVVLVLERALQLLRRGEGVDSFFVSNLANSLSKLEYGGRWRRLREEVLGAVSGWCEEAGFRGFTPQSLANLINGFAKLGYHSGKAVLDALAAECERREFEGFNEQDISNVINGFAKLEHYPGKDMLKAVAVACLSKGFADCTPQNLANVINGFAKLEHHPGEEMLQALADECLGRGFGGFTPQNMANLINGFAKLEHYPGKDILDALAAECLGRGFAGFDAQAMANLINGFAKLEHDPGKHMLKALVDECLQRGFKGFIPQHIANMINGFAKLGYPPGNEMLTALADECLRRGFGGFNAQAIANVINGFAKLGYYPGEAVLHIAAALCLGRRFAGFIPQDFANIIHGLAVLRHHPGEAFLQQLCTACQQRRFEGFNEQELSNTLYALAVLRHRPDEAWMGGFLGRCREVGWGSMTLQGLHLTLWTMEVLELRLDGGLVEELSARLRAAGKEGSEDVKRVCMTARQVLYLEGQAGADEALRQLAVAAEAAWGGVKHLVMPPTRSTLQREVCKMLREEGYEVKEEVMLDGWLSVDAVVRQQGGGGKVALEVDGSVHFFRNRPREATGEAVLKWRLMDSAVERGEVDGWVSVPWWVVHVHESLEGRRPEGEIREDLRRLVEGALSGRQRPRADVKERKDGGRGQERAGGKTGRQGGARGR